MKYIKMLGLAAIAAAALTAFVGAGTASASVLCKTATSPCTEKYGEGTEITAKLSSATAELKAGFANIVCKASSVAGKVENAGGSGVDVSGKISTLDFTECGEATVTVNTNGSLAAQYTSGGNGTLTVSGVSVTVKVGSTSCTYGGNITSGIAVTGGNPASVVASEAPIARTAGGILCANPSKWTASYEVTAPKPLYVAAS